MPLDGDVFSKFLACTHWRMGLADVSVQLARWNGLAQTSIHAKTNLVCCICRQQRVCVACSNPQDGSLPDNYLDIGLAGHR